MGCKIGTRHPRSQMPGQIIVIDQLIPLFIPLSISHEIRFPALLNHRASVGSIQSHPMNHTARRSSMGVAAFLVFTALCAHPAIAQPASQSATRPIAPRQGLRLADFAVHDPWILAHEPSRTYYLYTSASPRVTGMDRFGTMVYKSKDLATWDGPYVVFKIPDRLWANPMHGAWAPEVHLYSNKYYLFTTLHNRDTIIAQPPDVWRVNHARGTTIAVADSPEG